MIYGAGVMKNAPVIPRRKNVNFRRFLAVFRFLYYSLSVGFWGKYTYLFKRIRPIITILGLYNNFPYEILVKNGLLTTNILEIMPLKT